LTSDYDCECAVCIRQQRANERTRSRGSALREVVV
jgi:hypothetical protein